MKKNKDIAMIIAKVTLVIIAIVCLIEVIDYRWHKADLEKCNAGWKTEKECERIYGYTPFLER